ncbi:MAG: aldo/keto reductase, partial [Acutalibacteraceae bacterium]
ASLDQSLKRMKLDYVDIFYHHRIDPDTPLEETMGALDAAVKSGKALYAGLSNYDGETMKKAAEILESLHCPFVINQNRYSILDRTIEKNGLKDAVKEKQKGLIVFSPLAQGMLTDRYFNGIPKDSRAVKDKNFTKYHSITDERIEKLKKLNAVAAERGQTLAQMALSWVMKDGYATSVLIGASNPKQILDDIGMINNTNFTGEELQRIDEISENF